MSYKAVKLSKKEKIPEPEVSEDLTQNIENFVASKLGNRRELTRKNVASILRRTLSKLDLNNLTDEVLIMFFIQNKYRKSTSLGMLKWMKRYAKYKNISLKHIDFKEISASFSNEDAKVRREISHDEFNKLINCELVTPYYKLIWKFMSSCGIRVRELSRLTVSDFDSENWNMKLPSNKSKAKVERWFPIVEDIRKEFAEATNFVGKSPEDPLFSRNNKPHSAVGLSNRFKKDCIRAGLVNKHVHLLRAYSIQKILQSGGTEMLIKNICGWSSREGEKYTRGMSIQKDELAVNMSFSRKPVDTTREYDTLVENVITAMNGRADQKKLAVEAGVSEEWIYGFTSGKGIADIVKLLKVVKTLDHSLEFIADRSKKHKTA